MAASRSADKLSPEANPRTFAVLNTAGSDRGTNLKTNTDTKLSSTKSKKEPDIERLQPGSAEHLISKCDIGLGEPPKGLHDSRKPTLSTRRTQNGDGVPMKRPVKLAPLDLPAQTKEGHLQKMRPLEDLLDKQKDSIHVARETVTKRTIKADPFIGTATAQTSLPKLKKDQSASNGRLPVDSSLPLHLGQENIQEEPSAFSKLKLRSILVNKSLPSNTLLRSSDAEAFVKSRFRHLAKQSENQSRSKPVRAICLDMDFLKPTTGKQSERNHVGGRIIPSSSSETP